MCAVFDETGYILDPHGAVGYRALADHLAADRGSSGIFLETAHPVKFDSVTEILGTQGDVPESVADLYHSRKTVNRDGCELWRSQRSAAKQNMKVMKFGGSSVADAESIKKVVEIIRSAQAQGACAAVMSAMYGTTDALIAAGQAAERGDDGYLAILNDIGLSHTDTIRKLFS